MAKLSENHDYKAMSVNDADMVFQEIALISARLNKIKAGYDKRIADTKASALAEAAPFENELKAKEIILSNYITAHPQRFLKPRMRKTEFGKYGVRSSTRLDISDELAAVASVKAQAIPALILSEKLDKKALEKAIGDGMTIDGVSIEQGEIASYTVAREILDKAGN